MSDRTMARLYDQWLDMWNGDFDIAGALVASNCVIHQAPMTHHGPEGVRQMVVQGRAPFATLTFRVEVPPIVSGAWLAARWIGEGAYRDGIPGATVEPGTPIAFGGNDIWRLDDGRIVEYWVSSDGLDLMRQLGIGSG